MSHIKYIIAGFQFLTRLPFNVELDFDEMDMTEVTKYYPIIGLILGLIVAAVMFLFNYIGPNVSAIMGVTSLVIITGGLHLDGLADVFDGFFSNKERDQIIEIMKDSHVGTFGVVALIIVILLKYALFSEIIKSSYYPIVLTLINSRITMSFQSMGPIIPESTFGKILQRTNFSLIDLIIMGAYIIALFIINPVTIVPLIMSIAFGYIIKLYSYEKIGGVNGDVMGATTEMAEIISMISFLGVMEWL